MSYTILLLSFEYLHLIDCERNDVSQKVKWQIFQLNSEFATTFIYLFVVYLNLFQLK